MKEMKQKIIDTIKDKNPELLDKVKKELDILSSTEGINDENNLKVFYNIWQKNINKVGNKNIINSWTAYGLGITSKQPEGDFLPERRAFARAGFPDIDTDFDDERRGEIHNYIIEKYGRENVGNIGTHGLLKFKSCVTRVVKALDIADSFHKGREAYITDNADMVTEILNSFPMKGALKVRGEDGEFHMINSINDAYQHNDKFRKYMDKYPQIKMYVEKIEGIFATPSVHASGIVISDVPLKKIAPLRTANKGMLATQFTADQLESLGLIKFDILGLSTLSVIKHTLKMIKENYDIDIDITKLPLDDEKTFELYRTGNLGGVFQCEQWGMQDTMKQIGVDSFDDIMAAIALYRPGPMDNIPSYCAIKRGEIDINYFHPSIEKFVKPYLKNTYGILCIHESTLISMGDGTHKPIKEVKINDRVLSYNENNDMIENNIICGCAPTRKCDGYKIILNNGSSIILTEDHKIYTWGGMKEVRDLNIKKDIIGCPSIIHCSEKSNNFKEIGEEKALSYFLGFATGDGSIRDAITLCIGNEENSIILEKWININLSKIRTYRYQHCRSWYIGCAGKEFIKEWKKIGVGNRKTKLGMFIDKLDLRKNCYNKRIPNEIFISNNEVKSCYLAGLIDSDGCVFYKKQRLQINYTSVNKKLLEDVRHLCNHLGINTTISGNKVVFNDIRLTINIIKNFLVLKKKKCEDIINEGFIGWQGRNIFYSKCYLEKKRKDLQLSQRSFSKKYNINRSNYRNKEFLSIQAINNFATEYPYHKNHLWFYKIKSIEKIKNVQFYGISVKNNHNLFGNGILISNCYQEQLMQICNSLANFSITDGYIMIKAIGKKKKYLMDKYEKQFVEGCISNNVKKGIAQEYWNQFIIPFANYGFNRSHAVAYSLLSYTCCYLKANYPDEYICSLLNVEILRAKHEKVEKYEKEFKKRMNIMFLPRDINKCQVLYTVEMKKDLSKGVTKTHIRPSLLCKGMGENSAKNIVENQPYKNLKDFAEKTTQSIVDLKSFTSLLENGYIGGKSGIKNKEKLVKEFIMVRQDLNKASKKGVESGNIFE